MNAFLQCAVYVAVLLALAKPLGAYMANVYEGRTRFLAPLESLVYRFAGVKPEDDMDWKRYLWATLWFNFIGFGAVYALQRLQDVLPLNPQKMAAVSPDSSFNTAVSFATNTNWQGYGGETTMSYLTQMLGLSVQNFLSAATGMAVLIALVRGFARKQAGGIGNFWVDLTRSTLYILLPLSLLLAGALVTQGVVQTFEPYKTVTLVQPVQYQDGKETKTATEQTLALGPGRLADRDQAARHQRRRLLQRQLGASVREPDAAVQLPRAARDPGDPGRAVLHLRPHDRRHAPGLGAARRDDDRLRRLPHGLRRSRSRPATRSSPSSAWHSRSATWKARKCASASPTRRCGPPQPPRRRTARSTRCTTRSRRSAEWCR